MRDNQPTAATQSSTPPTTETWYKPVSAGAAPNTLLVSSAAVRTFGAHDRLRIWSRGGYAGEIMVEAGDGERIATQFLMLNRDEDQP